MSQSNGTATGETIEQVRINDAAPRWGKIQGRRARVISGTLMPDFYGDVVVPEYQREPMKHLPKHDDLVEALAPDGIGIPDDLLLCVRTDKFDTLGSGELIIPTTGLILLDGHQRMTAAWARQGRNLPVDPMGVKIFLGTTLPEEIATFYQVNRLQTKVSTDVLLRNSGTNVAIEALRRMIKDSPDMVNVKWDHLSRGEDITAHMLYEVAVILHGGPRGATIERILVELLDIVDDIGTELLVQNVKLFFEVLQRAYGDTDNKDFMYRIALMRAMASLFRDHEDFWDSRNPKRLQVSKTDITRLKRISWRVVDADLRRSNATADLTRTLIGHLNKFRKTGMLVPRSTGARS